MLVAIDVETTSLRGGQQLSISLRGDYRSTWACAPEVPVSDWVRDNVLPQLPRPTHDSWDAMLQSFAHHWLMLSGNENLTVAFHMGMPVESNLFDELFKRGYIGEFQGPYKYVDVATLLMANGFNHDQQTAAAIKLGLIPDLVLSDHSSDYDAEVTYRLARHFLS